MNKLTLFVSVIAMALLHGCGGCNCEPCPAVAEPLIQSDSIGAAQAINYGVLPVKSTQGFVQGVIEIPAGTSHKFEYNYEENSFPCDQKNGADRIIPFLPYPGNYGFIPSTKMDTAQGGDGDALDILILGESVPTATVMDIIPIGILQLLDEGEIDDKLIAIPADKAKQVLQVADVNELDESIRTMISSWFENYDGPGVMEMRGWAGHEKALAEIDRWTIKH